MGLPEDLKNFRAADLKPRLKVVGGKPVLVAKRETPVEAARRRHGKPFAHDTGSTYKPRETPFLQEWLASRFKERA